MIKPETRPVHLDLRRIHLPVAGVMSIVHRITGAILFLAFPFLVWLLGLSLSGSAGYAQATATISAPLGTLVLLLLLWALMHHLLAGIRYLLLDVHIGLEKPLYRQTALGVLIAAPVLALLLLGGVR